MDKFSTSEIEKINNRFYEALNNCDLQMMEEIWLNDYNAKCIHPGDQIIKGWYLIKDSWKNIFESGNLNHVDISKQFIDIKGESAWVNCIERVSYRINNEIIITVVQTTNIFEFIDDSWRLVLHHSSPMPMPANELDDINLQ